jgi:hypothetical protein
MGYLQPTKFESLLKLSVKLAWYSRKTDWSLLVLVYLATADWISATHSLRLVFLCQQI